MKHHYTPEETVDFNLRYAWNSIARMYNQLGVKHDLTMSIGFVLLNIDKDGTPSTQLGPKMGMEPRSLTRTLKALEEKGWIYKQADEKDRRMVRVFLTEEGKKKRMISRDTVVGFNDLVHEKIAPQKLKVFLEVVSEITKLVNC